MVDYGYEEASPDIDKYGYGDAAPDIDKYGYGDAAPDIDKYCYGDAAPDIDKYGYGAAAPDTEKYGYGDATPDTESRGARYASRGDIDVYGYGDASPRSSEAPPKRHNSASDSRPRVGRRSSMKQGGAPRRSSITFTGEISNILPGQRSARRRTSISFNESTEIKEVEPVRHLTDNPKDLWFQKKEFDVIREKAVLLTNLAKESIDDSSSFEKKKLCFRGLESHINSAYVDMEQNLAWRSVFLEQYHQRKGGDFDDEVVAKVYAMATMPSRARALERAAGDSKEAQKHTKGVRNAMRRHSMLS